MRGALSDTLRSCILLAAAGPDRCGFPARAESRLLALGDVPD